MGAARAQDGAPSLITRCTSPGNCITLNTGPCGTLLSLDQGVISVLPPSSPASLQEPGIHGFCGFIDNGYASSTGPANVIYCEPGSDCSFTTESLRLNNR